MKTSMALKSLLGAAALALPLMASAESNVSTSVTGVGPLSAAARVNFSIVVAKTLYLRVGTGSAYTTPTYAANPQQDTITFTPAIAALGNSTPVAGTGGEAAASAETAAVVSNGGTVTLTANTGGALKDANGDAINYTEIKTTAAATGSGFTTLLNAPTLANGASSTNVVLTPTPAKGVIQADAVWTYAYANTAVVAPGTYGAVTAGGNGLVTYTATMP